jgi:hypothetical protein
MTDEPRYVPAGEEFDEDNWTANRRPKWSIPESSLERRILRAVGRKYYPDSKMKYHVRLITKAAVSLDSGIVSEYPIEWIEDRCEAVESMRKKRKLVELKGLITMINREEDKQDFINKYVPKEKPKPASRKLYFNVEDDDESEGV